MHIGCFYDPEGRVVYNGKCDFKRLSQNQTSFTVFIWQGLKLKTLNRKWCENWNVYFIWPCTLFMIPKHHDNLLQRPPVIKQFVMLHKAIDCCIAMIYESRYNITRPAHGALYTDMDINGKYKYWLSYTTEGLLIFEILLHNTILTILAYR